MKELKRRLVKELQQDFNVKIMDTMLWNFPVHSIEIAFHTVMRTKMDVLMKMILIAFQKGAIATEEELSDVLLVEPLFINDLLSTMTRTHMIEKSGVSYTLTDVGRQQLESGIFIHEPEISSKKVLYSPCHQFFMNRDKETNSYETEEIYRYQKEFNDWEVASLDDKDLVTALQSAGVESTKENAQIVVSEIISATEIQIEEVPCIEFRLYNAAEDVFYARVWNTLLGHWDEMLEAQLNERERKKWREDYL